MSEFLFFDFSEDQPDSASVDTWFTEAASSPPSFDSPRSEDFECSEVDSEPGSKKTRAKWSHSEDMRLQKLYEEFPDQWEKIESMFGSKNRNQLKSRWLTKHDPNFKHRKWTSQEDQIIIDKFNSLGGKWIKISTCLHNRSSIAIKNRYYSVLRKKLDSTEIQQEQLPKCKSDLIQQLADVASRYEQKITEITKHIQYLEESIDIDCLINQYNMIILILLTQVFADPIWSQDDIGHDLSECYVNHTREMFYYWKQSCIVEDIKLPSPIRGIECNKRCPAGTILDYDIEAGQMNCIDCPRNTFNIGGGMWFSGAMDNWDQFQSQFVSYCWTSGFISWHLGVDWVPWAVDPSKKFLVSGEAFTDTWVESQLIFSHRLLFDGHLKIRYRKITKVLNNFSNGDFKVFVNNEEKYIDSEVNNENWKEKTIQLLKGQVEIVLVFEKYGDQETGILTLELEHFEVRGTGYAARECYPCKQGFSNEGSSSCNLCEPGTYYNEDPSVKPNNAWVACPDHLYSVVGSIGIENCKPKPPCTPADYTYLFSECDSSNKRTASFASSPGCARGTPAPHPFEDECEHCISGFYPATKGCQACPSGQFLENESCYDCPSGTYATKWLNYTSWENLSDNFKAVCNHEQLIEWDPGSEWMDDGTRLVSKVTQNSVDLVLQGEFNFTCQDSFVSFEATPGVILGIDGVDQQPAQTYPIQRGHRYLHWHAMPTPGATEAIYNITIHGASEGGSTRCQTWEIGYISIKGQSHCDACPPGTTSDEDHISCVKCGKGQYSLIPGPCLPCPQHTVPNDEQTACLGHEIITFEDQNIYIKNLTGIELGTAGYSQGICMKEYRALYCTDTFYGPIYDNVNSFFVSVMNPSEFSIPKYQYVDDLDFGYAFGVFNLGAFNSAPPGPSSSNNKCIRDEKTYIANLGTRLRGIDQTENGFSIIYDEGSSCHLNHDERYSVRMDFVCDRQEREGWPILSSNNTCQYSFRWSTAFACRICSAEDITPIRGKCIGGERKVTPRQSSDWIVLNPDLVSLKYYEPCSEAHDLIKTWPIVVGLTFMVFLCIFWMVCFFCCCRAQYKYQQLKEEMEEQPSVLR